MKSNRQIGLDGRIFIADCLSDGIFFVYSIILSGILSAAGDIMKLLGTSSHGLDLLTNSLILMDLVASLSMVMVAYYVYFMHCGENMPQLGIKPLIWLEYFRLAYYGLLLYQVLYRFAYELKNGDRFTKAIPIFYFFYVAWLVTCVFAAMFILTVLHQNVIRRSYAKSFKWLSLIGLGINIVLPLAYFVTRFWVHGVGDGFYSAGFCDFVRLALAPICYVAIWFLFMNAIDQVDRVFSEVDNAIRDKRYRIEFEEETENAKGKKSASPKKQKAASGDKESSENRKKKGGKKVKPKKKHRIKADNGEDAAAPAVSSEETVADATDADDASGMPEKSEDAPAEVDINALLQGDAAPEENADEASAAEDTPQV